MNTHKNANMSNTNGNGNRAGQSRSLFGGGSQSSSAFSRPAFGSSSRPNQIDLRPCALLPVRGKQVVYFQLNGLGDPFYRLLNHSVDASASSARQLVERLSAGGDDVDALRAVIEAEWAKYSLRGAIHFHTWDQRFWENLLKADEPAQRKTAARDDDNDANKDGDEANDNRYQPGKLPVGQYRFYRALDIALVLNVLARTRSQLLIARAAPMFTSGYLLRAMATDDPRIVSLAHATGCIEVF